MSVDFRRCVHCGVDCFADGWEEGDERAYRDENEVEHADDCPMVTGLFPVTMAELGMRGPNDPYAHGMICMDCHAPFALGDVYARRDVDGVFEIVCVGCRVLSEIPA